MIHEIKYCIDNPVRCCGIDVLVIASIDRKGFGVPYLPVVAKRSRIIMARTAESYIAQTEVCGFAGIVSSCIET